MSKFFVDIGQQYFQQVLYELRPRAIMVGGSLQF